MFVLEDLYQGIASLISHMYINHRVESSSLDSVLVVCEIPNMFPTDLPSTPLTMILSFYLP